MKKFGVYSIVVYFCVTQHFLGNHNKSNNDAYKNKGNIL